jgi:hypothetical protein
MSTPMQPIPEITCSTSESFLVDGFIETEPSNIASVSSFRRRCEARNVQLDHFQHGVSNTPSLVAIGITHQVCENSRHDLPGQAVLVLEPATLFRLAAAFEHGVPVAVDFGLIVA